MRIVLICIAAGMVAACSNLNAAHQETVVSPCVSDEASYACQVERYSNVND
jgi:hypothetical protein